jgi:hypothetical protein
MIVVWLAAVAVAVRPPDPFSSCDALATFYGAELRPKPEQRPTLWWLQNDPPCEYGQTLQGAPPPQGKSIACVDLHGHLYGPQSVFSGDGKVITETYWLHNKEIGPRLEWDPATYQLIRRTQLRGGRVDGEVVEWLPDGGVLVEMFQRGTRTGPTWRLDERHQILLIEQWRAGGRHGRTCAWRDGSWVEQVWTNGEAASVQPAAGR